MTQVLGAACDNRSPCPEKQWMAPEVSLMWPSHIQGAPPHPCAPSPASPHPGCQRDNCQEKHDPGSFHTQAWSSRWEKNLPVLQVLLLLIVLILLRGGEKQNQTFDCTEEEKKRIRKEKECLLWETHIWMIQQATKISNRAAANLLLGEGKPSRSTTKGWDWMS